MRLDFVTAGLVILLSVVGVRLWENRPEEAAPSETSSVNSNTVAKVSYNRKVRVAVAHNHQYYLDADVNRRRARFLIDTGASYVAMRESDMQRAGVLLNDNDFTHVVSTANGKTRAAFVSIDEIEVDGLVVTDVEAFVLPDNKLDINLLGMSFLSRLSSVETRNGEMILTR